jgi:hypothetical protein
MSVKITPRLAKSLATLLAITALSDDTNEADVPLPLTTSLIDFGADLSEALPSIATATDSTSFSLTGPMSVRRHASSVRVGNGVSNNTWKLSRRRSIIHSGSNGRDAIKVSSAAWLKPTWGATATALDRLRTGFFVTDCVFLLTEDRAGVFLMIFLTATRLVADLVFTGNSGSPKQINLAKVELENSQSSLKPSQGSQSLTH